MPKTTFKDRPQDINRNGRPTMSKEMMALRKYATGEIIETFERVVRMTVQEAAKWITHPECTLLDYTLIMAMKKGQLNVVLDRLLGRVPETVNLHQFDKDIEKIDTTGMSEEEKKKLYLEKSNQISGKQ